MTVEERRAGRVSDYANVVSSGAVPAFMRGTDLQAMKNPLVPRPPSHTKYEDMEMQVTFQKMEAFTSQKKTEDAVPFLTEVPAETDPPPPPLPEGSDEGAEGSEGEAEGSEDETEMERYGFGATKCGSACGTECACGKQAAARWRSKWEVAGLDMKQTPLRVQVISLNVS
jgi:hypothetical protein